MNDVCIRFSRLRGRENSVLTKQYRLDDQGQYLQGECAEFHRRDG